MGGEGGRRRREGERKRGRVGKKRERESRRMGEKEGVKEGRQEGGKEGRRGGRREPYLPTFGFCIHPSIFWATFSRMSGSPAAVVRNRRKFLDMSP